MKKIFIHTLGCPRNKVDSEIFHNTASQAGYELTDKLKKADVILINTCGFIQEAKEESIDEILIYNTARKKNSHLIVTGCLNKRYKEELKQELPEVDYFVELKDYQGFSDLLAAISKKKPATPPADQGLSRKLLDNAPYAYLKISDGCNNKCSYCTIPQIRGAVNSDDETKLINEVSFLAEQGIKELIITAMDITQYGVDLASPANIVRLLEKVTAVNGIEWVRLLYLHPRGISADLIRLIRENEKICPYFDIPIQHINDDILKSMNRHLTRYEIEKLIDTIRVEIPEAVLRTSVIVGYPGETKEQYKELLDFVRKTEFNRLGAFIYSREEGTPAYSLPEQIDLKTARKREKELMKIQEKISEKLLCQYIGQTLPVIIDTVEKCEDEFYLEGRTRYDAPEIDGLVTIENGYAPVGSIVNVTITESWEHDLNGELSRPTLTTVK